MNREAYNSNRKKISRFLYPVLFFSRYLTRPRQTGNIAPSGFMVANAMRNAVSLAPEFPVLEIGGGTGAITRRISDLNPTVIEINPSLYNTLRLDFPQLDIKQGCAIAALRELNNPVGLICSIPLINNPAAAELIATIEEQQRNGLIKYCAVLTYGLRDPLKKTSFPHRHRAWCTINIPPAFVWSYWQT